MEPSTPLSHESDAPVPMTMSFENARIEYEEPLYTEINIPLPKLPAPPKSMPQTSASTTTSSSAAATQSSPSKPSTQDSHSRTRARSMSAFSFRSRSSSTASSSSSTSPPPPSASPRHSADDSWPRIRPSLLRSRETAAAMDLGHASKKRGRSGTVDALAVVPAVLVLSAELFTPGTGKSRGGLVEGMR